MKRTSWVLGVGVLAACLAFTGCAPVTIPDVVGMTQTEASLVLTDAGLGVGAVTQEHSSTVAAGLVVSQLPVSGTAVNHGSNVALIISEGPQSVSVPNVVGATQAQAAPALIGAGLVLGAVSQAFSATVPVGQVISQAPAAGTSAAPGTAVNLVLSQGPSPVSVPNVTGMTRASAESAITGAGLIAGSVTQYYSLTVPVGNVISQTPAAGTGAAPGTAVDLVVSMGPQTEMITLQGGVTMEMMWIGPGWFTMGSPASEQDRTTGEGPQHTVTVSGFWMSRFELTKRQWASVMGTSPWTGQPNVLDDPDSSAVCVSWDDAEQFMTMLSVLTAQSFRLPSEAEWEYACRADTNTRFYWGDDPFYTVINDYAWYSGNCSSAMNAHLAGQRFQNAFGLFDMSGNVAEWCEDDFHSDYTDAPAQGQAWVETPREPWRLRVIRGGNFGYGGDSCRSASRNANLPDGRYSYNGIRVVRTP